MLGWLDGWSVGEGIVAVGLCFLFSLLSFYEVSTWAGVFFSFLFLFPFIFGGGGEDTLHRSAIDTSPIHFISCLGLINDSGFSLTQFADVL